MAKLSVHPHKGFLNTKFIIRSHSEDYNVVSIYSKVKDKVDTANPVSLLDKESLHDGYVFKNPGRYVVMLDNNEDSAVEVYVEDAIKFGGSTYKNSYVFEETPWCFVVMKDRTYFYNRDTDEQYVENFSPDEISCVNKDVVLLSNKYDERTLYSLTEQRPLITYSNEILLNKDTIIFQNEVDGKTKLNVVRFNDVLLDKKEYLCDCFSLCEDAGVLYFHEDKTIYTLSLETLEIIKSLKRNYRYFEVIKFIKFTNGHYFVEIQYFRHSANILVCDILSNDSWYVGNLENPLFTCEDVDVIDTDAEKDKIKQIIHLAHEYDLFNKEKPQLLGGINISYKYIEINKFYVLSRQLYYLIGENSFTLERTGLKNEIHKLYLRTTDNNFEIEISDYNNVTREGDYLFIKTCSKGEKLIVLNGDEVVLRGDFAKYSFAGRIFLSEKDKDGDESIYEFHDGKITLFMKGNFKWDYFEKYGILEQRKDKGQYAIYAFSPKDSSEYSKFEFDNNTDYGFREYTEQKHLKYGNKELYCCGVMLWNAKVDLPEDVKALSEELNYAISVKGTHVFLGRMSKAQGGFINVPILESLFDTSTYGNVLMSDDGENIVYQKGDDLILMNTGTQEEQYFPNTSFISQINGYRPLFKVDGSHRRPRVIDPMTRQYINQDYITNYRFVSPDGKLYADSALSKYIKHLDRINKVFISKEQFRNLIEKYDYQFDISNEEKDKKKEARKEFINMHKDYFKNRNIEDLLNTTTCFTDIITEDFGYATIRKVETDEVYCEIALGHTLRYLNYVAFSYDSRYVAIVGRYPDFCSYKGLLLVYDMEKQKEIEKNTTHRAVWTAAFTQKGFYAAYDSLPTLLYGNVNDDSGIDEVSDRNFLTFSPDGKYMALSNQGYVAYKDENHKWGHQPSTMVYIHSVENPNEQIVPTISDLSDAGVADTNNRKSVASCSFSLDNKKLMMVGRDGIVVIRNLHIE